MGKSSKKSATKVDVAPVAVTQSGKKGKRGAEKEIEKAVSAKKQKVERDETVVAKQKIEKKLPKKAASSSSSDDSSDDFDSDSDSEPKVVAKKTPVAAVKNGSVVAKKPKEDSSSDSSDSSESDSDDSDEKPAAKKQPTTAIKNGSAPAKKAPASESSSSESDSEDEEPAVVKNVAKKESSSSDSESDSESSDEEEEKVAAPVAAAKAKAESSDSDSDEDSSDSDEEPKATQAKATPAKAVAKPTKADSSSSEESSDEDSSEDDEPAKAEPVKKVQAATKSESSSSDDESSDDDSDDSDEEETDKQSLKTPKKKDTDVEMVDAEKSAGSTFQKTPKTPATPEATGSKTLFVGNLSFSIQEAHVRDFFKDAGEVVDVRFASNAEGLFRGFGHVEFATAEAAQKAMELHDQPLLDRPVRLDLARERDANRSAFTPQNREARGQTAFVRGFDTSQGEDEIRSALQQHFGSCGEITRISIPKDYESGTVKGICYMDFTDSDGFNKALGMDGSDLGGGCYLTVQEAKPRGDSAGGSGGRFDRGGSGGRRGGGRFGGRGGRDGGGRFSGGRGGRDGGRGRGGRGTPYNKPNMTPMGKKTTFDD